ncbi:hypothetical protein [Nitrincola tapanii]|uniref:Uncharacterized protein n=1 Tax=Nitrincola tapanii TaxID=1708751 RepID=A0A5A9W6E1_9GAMM|nr:hypothetical protein [Nitrincola tapanii]KAA0875688.1 hypothetical protein E1H14_03035 [Nitrincola tapanii]
MSPSETAIIILMAVFVMMMVAIAFQSAENLRQERHFQLLALRDQYRRCEHLLNNFPTEFMTAPLRSALLNFMRLLLKRMHQIQRNSELNHQMEALAQIEEAPLPSPYFPENQGPSLFAERNAALRARALVREMVELVSLMSQQGFAQTQMQALLAELKLAYQRCQCDLLLHEAHLALQQSGPKVAIHHLRTALMQLKKLNPQGLLDAQLIQLQGWMHEIEVQATAPQPTAPQSHAPEAQSSAAFSLQS